jgi:hypothetical protein
MIALLTTLVICQQFTLNQHSRSTGGPNGEFTLELRTTAQCSDGSRVLKTEGVTSGYRDRVITLASGLELAVYDEVGVVSTLQTDPAHPPLTKMTVYSGCVSPEFGAVMGPVSIAAQEAIGGVATNKIVSNSDTTIWYAPALGCQSIQEEIHFTGSTTRLEFDKINYSEPDSSLFAIPSGYAELPPSQAIERRLRHANVPSAAVDRIVKGRVKEDEFYLAHRPQ